MPTSRHLGDELYRSPRPRITHVVWLGVGVGLLALLALSQFGEPAPGKQGARLLAVSILEPWLLVGLLWVAFRETRVRDVLDPRQALVVMVIIAGAFIGQFSMLHQLDAYPLTDWSMYTVPAESVPYTEFTMVDEDGQDLGHLPIDVFAPAPSERAFMARLSEWIEQADEGDEEASSVVETTLHAVLDRLERPEVVAVDVLLCTVEAPNREEPAQCVNAMTVLR